MHYKEKQLAKQQEQVHYNRRSKPLSQLTEGQSVRVHSKPGAASWEKGTVTRVLPSQGAYTTSDDAKNKSVNTGNPKMSPESPEVSSPKPVIVLTERLTNNQPCRTRSGHIVDPPKHLKEYSM